MRFSRDPCDGGLNLAGFSRTIGLLGDDEANRAPLLLVGTVAGRAATRCRARMAVRDAIMAGCFWGGWSRSGRVVGWTARFRLHHLTSPDGSRSWWLVVACVRWLQRLVSRKGTWVQAVRVRRRRSTGQRQVRRYWAKPCKKERPGGYEEFRGIPNLRRGSRLQPVESVGPPLPRRPGGRASRTGRIS